MRRNPGHAASKRPGSNFPSIVNWLISEFKSFVWNLNFVAQQNLSSDIPLVGLAVDEGCSVGVTVSIGCVESLGFSGGIARVVSISLLSSDLSGSEEVLYNIKDQLWSWPEE